MSTSRRSLQERMRGQRRSQNIEDRRGEKVIPDDESDKYPPIYEFPEPMSEDIKEPLGTEYELQTHIPIYKAREALKTGRDAARNWLYQPTRRRRKRPTLRKK